MKLDIIHFKSLYPREKQVMQLAEERVPVILRNVLLDDFGWCIFVEVHVGPRKLNSSHLQDELQFGIMSLVYSNGCIIDEGEGTCGDVA